ncbi:2'-5' RNA ligase [Deinococcus proteolyticus MRP]|uniref:RNA 2',3'-cyclic phosphodiesterase n=1 Tax=Deinococcus proteolyticus (strain ATCC 35074 / DSM 20540 / JCM 6276 / NBRC 101906 / NCIMB 13154 / VKM Ac-1939 / CCM 2703 / MRP) TaxID=693977 RepID=F0RN66_DEIPM|nr:MULTISPECIES: RNA 2',3'-cyclic phosphodiesterase [Deinococcus]ADY26208.1 2'-5' RNA ligase [Deinococcus proteolyticus MRP]MCY1702323.1 RNA 2',3'-cyclic phosphodiesterase [Deinococcus sp. SL84]
MTGSRSSSRGRRPAGPSAAGSGRLRLFYALKVPDSVAAELAQAQSKLRGNWRRVEPAQLHITLAYLPGVPADRLDDLKRLGVQAAQTAGPLDIALRGTGYFPNEGSPRVWFVKAEAAGLDPLAEALRAGVAELGLDTDDKAFKAHVTLARKKGPAPRLPPLVFEDTGWTAGHVSLVKSVLRKTGPVYQTLSRFELRGAPAGDAAPDPTAKLPESAGQPQENS